MRIRIKLLAGELGQPPGSADEFNITGPLAWTITEGGTS
jgi:hypothetical protein